MNRQEELDLWMYDLTRGTFPRYSKFIEVTSTPTIVPYDPQQPFSLKSATTPRYKDRKFDYLDRVTIPDWVTRNDLREIIERIVENFKAQVSGDYNAMFTLPGEGTNCVRVFEDGTFEIRLYAELY